MTEELKNKKLDDGTMEMVSGGTDSEMISDQSMVASLLGLRDDEVGPGVVGEAFDKAKIKIYQKSGSTANEYKYDGRRISRYEALVLVSRAHGKGNFDITPYLGDTSSDNQINVKH